jgi:NADPH:quinone reductase-like Zn-dependent oxidoreductase
MTKQPIFRLPQRTSIQDLQVSEEDVPEPSAQEILIQIKNVALNYLDFAVSTGKYPFPVKDNVVPCSDLSGEVIQVAAMWRTLLRETR